MLDNNTYNLFTQITEESQSLWRIRNSYLSDSGPCGEFGINSHSQHLRDLN